MTFKSKFRIAGILVAAGLLIQFLSLLLMHPLAFIVFVSVGAPIMLAGIVLFLVGLVTGDGLPDVL